MKELTMHRLLLRVREQEPNRVFFVDGDTGEDAATHIDRTLCLVGGLRALGLQPGSRIAIVTAVSSRFMSLCHAAALGGFVVVPINTRLNAPELAALLQDCMPAVVVVDEFYDTVVAEALRLISCSLHVLHLGGPERWAAACSTVTWDEVLATGQPHNPDEPGEDDPLLMLYTGGTTGRARGVVGTHRQIVLSINRLQNQLDVAAEGTVLLSVNPLFHIGVIASAFAFPTAGASVVLRPAFDLEQVLSDVPRYRVTHLNAVTPILQRILEAPGFRPEEFDSLRSISYGASPMPPPLLRRLLEAFPGVDVQQVYGLTEAFGGVTALSGADHRAGGELLRSVGRALPGVVVTIRDSSGAALPSGEDGEICVSSGSAVTRYWGDSVDLPEPEYVRTGDLGRKDPLGYLFLVDRIKDMIKSGGENVYSVEVEAALAEHPEVDSVAVVGVPDERWGERVHAEVVPRAGSTLTPADVIAFARERLSAFKAPKSVTIRNAPLPVSAVGKVLKRQLRAEAAESAPTSSSSSPRRPNCSQSRSRPTRP